MTKKQHGKRHAETLSGGVASIDKNDEEQQVRIVPLGEGDITRGGSGKETYWDREVLKEAVDSGAFDKAKLLKGRPGEGHKDMLEQADPDEIVGSAGTFEYEDGVGPVSENAEVLDDHLAELVDAGLVEVSPDMWRVLGEYDEDLSAYRVDEILDVPYITILDRGASAGASIEPAGDGVEALGSDVGRWKDRVHELSETLGVPSEQLQDEIDASERGVDVTIEQLSRLFTLRFRAYGEMFGDEFLDEAVANLEAIEGISATRSEDNDDPELVAIVDREAVASLDELNDQIIDALQDTPFEVPDGYDWIEDVAWEGLAGSSGPEAQNGDERAEPRAGTGTGDSGTSGTSQNMADTEELQEQLAEVRTERDSLVDEKEDLEEQLSEKEETIENKEERIEQLEEEIDPLVDMLAELAAEDSPLQAEQLADRFEPSELVETLALDAGWSEDDDENPVEIVREQLAGSPTPRGESEPDGTPGGDLGEEEKQHAEQLAGEVMTAQDTLAAEGSNYEYLKQEYDVDAAEYDDVEQLRAAVRGNGGA
jgi:TolA-binding protein